MSNISWVALNNIKRLRAYYGEEKKCGILRNVFYSQDNSGIVGILKSDLQHFMDNWDVNNLRLISLDDFVKSFLSKISLVHKSPVIVKLDNNVNEEQGNRFRKLLTETDFHRVLQDTEMRMKLHNTLLLGIRYFDKLDKLYLDNSFDAGTTQVFGFDGFEQEERYVVRHRINKEEKDEYVVWDRANEYNYRILSEPKYDASTEDLLNDKYDIKYDMPFNFVPSYYPFVKYRNNDQNSGFWGNGMDGLIELVRTINVLLTITGDDAIGESLRILLMNFVPVGIDGKPGHFKVGMRNPLIATETDTGQEARAEIVSADLYVDEITTLIDKLVDQMSSMHGIDNVLTKEIKADVSGVAMRIKNEHMMRTWKVDINIVRKYDYELLSKLVEVNNYHRPSNKIDPKIIEVISLDYAAPNYNIDPMEEYNLERMKWQDGLSSPIMYVMKHNPEFTKEDAIKFIEENLDDTDKFQGIGELTPITGSQFTDLTG